MKKVLVSINTIDKVKSFVQDVSDVDCELDLVSGRYVVDAKSMLALFSLDLSLPLELAIHADDEAADEIIAKLAAYLA